MHPNPAVAATSFDLKLDELMERKRTLSRGLLAPGDDEGDAGALFDAVVQTPSEAFEEPTVEVAAVAPLPVAPQRATLAPRQSIPRPLPIAAEPRWPSRIEYRPNAARDWSIFKGPVAGAKVETLHIVDPYACIDERCRGRIIEFVAMLAGAAQAIGAVSLVTWDADSVDLNVPESTAGQRYDLATRWRARFGEQLKLSHDQFSRRQRRDLHDRYVTASLAGGRRLIWDLGRGIDGVMNPVRDCRVNLSDERL